MWPNLYKNSTYISLDSQNSEYARLKERPINEHTNTKD